MSGAIKVAVIGAKRWGLAVAAMNAQTRAHLREAVQITTTAVTARARANVPMSDAADRKAKGRPGPGELRDTIRDAYSTDGLRGYVMAGHGKLPRRSRATRPVKLGPMKLAAFQRAQKRQALKAMRELGVYAMVINYGSPGRGIPASRFMDRAKEAERTAHISRIKNALSQAAAAASQTGGSLAA